MNALGVNQKQFADLLGVTQPAISKYLKDRVPPAPVLLNLARASATSIEWILTGEDQKSFPRVAEPSSTYDIPRSLEDKISRLPILVQKRLGDLIDAMISSPHYSG